MSAPTRKSSTSLATFWPIDDIDKFGRKTYLEPVLIKCCQAVGRGRKHTTRKGSEIIPIMSVWFEKANFIPKDGDMMLAGDHTAVTDPATVEAIAVKDIQIQDCSSIGQIDDIMVVA